MTGHDLAAAAKPAVLALGGGWMISSEAKAAGKDGGYRGWQLYLAGRAGVLGPASTDVVTAALGFFAPTLVQAAWPAGLAVAPLGHTVRRYTDVCRDWGRRVLADLADDDAVRLAEILERVARAADAAGLPLFAGWREQPLPDDGAARVAQLLHVLREHRGGAHLAAVRTVGLTPLEAVLAAGGPGNATFFGWAEPFPEVTQSVRDRHARAEDLTDESVAPAYAVLGDGEAAELVDLLASAADAVRPAA